jgi:ribosome biogenesis GTPase A
MSINWYPGHMKKTKELIEDHLKLVDVVVELLDARIPVSSKNPQLDRMIQGKERIVVFNKSDLADPDVLEDWIRYYKKQGILSIPITCITGEGVNRLIHEIRIKAEDKLKSKRDRGMIDRPIRVMIVGIPNVGKSSLINKLAGKRSAQIGNKPGVTRGKQWIRIRKGLELFDTPGILWPKIEDQQVGLNLAFVGSIKDDVIDIETIAQDLVAFLAGHYPKLIMDRYGVDPAEKTPLELMSAIALNRGTLLKKGLVDHHKIAHVLLDEFRRGKLGKISLEWPPRQLSNE